MMNIVIAYDGSDVAKAAIDDLGRAGLPRKANALVVSVGETLLPTPPGPMVNLPPSVLPARVAGTLVQIRAEADTARAEASALAREGTRRVHRLFPQWGVYSESVVGVPAEAVIEKAADWRADLIVLGSHARNALGRFVLGSLSKQVATEAPCSVRVARHVVERDIPVRIIVGVDGSPGAEAAIGAVALRSWPGGTEARVIAVDDAIRPTGTASLVPTAAAWISESNEEHLAKAHAMLEDAANRLLDAGLLVSRRTPKGRPQDLLSKEAAMCEADCVFVGAHSLTIGNERRRAGSVATALVTHAPCSVEIIRA
jgi:nucleotide-binding universal stress UspA family protein